MRTVEEERIILAQQYGAKEVEYCPIDGNPLCVCAVYGHNRIIEQSTKGREIGREQHPDNSNPAWDYLQRRGVFERK